MAKKKGIEFLKIDSTWLVKAMKRARKQTKKVVEKSCKTLMEGMDRMGETTLREMVMTAIAREAETGTVITRVELERMADEVIRVIKKRVFEGLGEAESKSEKPVYEPQRG